MNWIFGTLFLLIGLIGIIADDSPLAGLTWVFISLLLLPPVRNFVYAKTNRQLSIQARGIAIFVLFIAFGNFTGQSQDRKAQELAAQEAQAQAEKAAALQQQNVDYFNKNSSQILNEIRTDFESGNFKEAVSLSSKYLPAQNKDLIDLNAKANSELFKIEKAEKEEKERVERDAKTQEILVQLKSVPTSQYQRNRDLYQQLATYNPDVKKYKEKLNYFSEKLIEEQTKEAKKEREKWAKIDAQYESRLRDDLIVSYNDTIQNANPHLNFIKSKVTKTKGGYALWAVHDFFNQYSLSIGDDAKVISEWVAENREKLQDAQIVRIGLMGKGDYAGSSYFDLNK